MLTRPTWEELEAAMPFGVPRPDLPEGWIATPKAVIPGTVALVGVVDDTGTRRCNLSFETEMPDLAGCEPLSVGSIGSSRMWRAHAP